jgi:hypothetical protein
MDEYGFNNDSTINNLPYIIMHGDSYTEAYQLPRRRNFSSIVNRKFPDINVYNVGKAGNSLADYIHYADKINNEFEVLFDFFQVKYTDFTNDSIDTKHRAYLSIGANDNIHIVTQEPQDIYGNIPCMISEKALFIYPVFRYTYKQFKLFKKKDSIQPSTDETEHTNKDGTLSERDKLLIDWELDQLKERYQGDFAFLYITSLPNIDNSGINYEESDYEQKVKKYLWEQCNYRGIDIIDTKEAYLKLYQETNKLPNGFHKSRIGAGHINKYGHAIIADLIIDYIQQNIMIED